MNKNKPKKNTKVEFRCSYYEKKLLKVKAKKAGLTLSEFTRRSIFDKIIKERLSDDHIEIYKSLIQYQNNFKRIGNMFLKKDPNISKEVYQLANEIKMHLIKFNN